MLRLYIVRHGETIWNTEMKMQGWHDSPLTTKGIEAAKQVGEYLKEVEFNKVYSSPAGRAYDTAKYVVGDRPLQIQLEDDFREMSFGDWEGKSGKDILTFDEKNFRTLWKEPTQYEPQTGENFNELRQRARNGLNTVIEENQTGNILIVSHAAMIKTLIYEMKEETLNDSFWDNYFIPNCSVTTVNYKDGVFTVEKLGQTVDVVDQSSR